MVFSLVSCHQCCGSKYIEFGSGSWILAQFVSGSGYKDNVNNLEKINLKIVSEEIFSLKKVFFYKLKENNGTGRNF